MALTRFNEKGKIIISNRVIAGLIEDSMNRGYQRGRVYPGNVRGTAQEMLLLIHDDFHSSISVRENERGRLVVRFPAVLKYGESISRVTGALADSLRDDLEAALGQSVEEIVIDIKGMRGKSFVKREMEVRRSYEA